MTPNTSGLALAQPSILQIDPRRAALANDPFEPQSMAELFHFAERVAETEFAPKEFRGKPNDCFIAMCYGRNLGLGALQALQGVCVINGKPSVYGETFWAVVISHPDFLDCVEDVTEMRAEIILTRRGRTPYIASFSMEDAKIAGLSFKSGPWTQYPKGQLLWRARHRGAVALFADGLKGILPREIALDFIEGEIVQPRAAAPALHPSPASPSPAAAPAEQAAPAEADPVVTAEQVKQWNDAWGNALKGANVVDAKKRGEYKRAELNRLKLDRSGEMRVSQFDDSIRAAIEFKLPDPIRPVAAKAAPATSEPEAEQPEEHSGEAVESVESIARRYMIGLGKTIFEQDQIIGSYTKAGVIDWMGIASRFDGEAQRMGIA